MTGVFHIKRGLIQECLLSAYLFIICFELLAETVRENKNIGGIPLIWKKFESTIVANDATFAFILTLHLFHETIDALEAFKYVLKRVSFKSKDCTKELKLECTYFLGQAS